MEKEHNADSLFWIRCIGYTQQFEKFFTIGHEYEVRSGYVTNDNGFTYYDHNMRSPDNDPSTWFLSDWYQFEIVNDVPTPEHLDLSFEDVMGYAQ